MCKTLIVEDNVTFRQMLKESLCSRFPTMEIEEEPDGRDLYNKIDSFRPKIVFMDIGVGQWGQFFIDGVPSEE